MSNVIRHGLRDGEDRTIELGLELAPAELRITICHDGEHFDPAAYTAPDLDEPGEGGYGLHLMHELMDSVVHDRGSEGKPRLRLVKRRAGG